MEASTVLSRSESWSFVVEDFEGWIEAGPGYVAVERKIVEVGK